MFTAAAEAAITVAPRLLIPDWMHRFEMEKTIPWIPDGTPIFRIRTNSLRSNRMSFRSIRRSSGLRSKRMKRIAALIRLETTVAIATPSTVIPATQTRNRFSPTLMTPAMIRTIMGVRVSPRLRKIAASTLYRKITGIPRK